MARMSAPGGRHDRTGFLGRAKQLLRRDRKQSPAPVVTRPAHFAPMRGGVNLAPLDAKREKARYRAKPARVYTGVVPGSRAANRPDGLLVSRKRAWALIVPLRGADGIESESGTLTTYSRKRRGLMRLSREAGILPVLVTS